MPPGGQNAKDNCRVCSRRVGKSKEAVGKTKWRWSSPFWPNKETQLIEGNKRGAEDVRSLFCSLKGDIKRICEYEKKLARCPVAGVPSFEPLLSLTDMWCKLNRLEKACLSSTCEQDHQLRKKRYMVAMLKCCRKFLARDLAKECEVFEVRQRTMGCVLKSIVRLEKNLACSTSMQGAALSSPRRITIPTPPPSSRTSPRTSPPHSPKLTFKSSPSPSLSSGRECLVKKSETFTDVKPNEPCPCPPECDQAAIIKSCKSASDVTPPCTDNHTSLPGNAAVELDSFNLTYSKKNVKVELPCGSDSFSTCDRDQTDPCGSPAFHKNHPGGGFTKSTYRSDPDTGDVCFSLSYKSEPGQSEECGETSESVEERVRKSSRLWYKSAQLLCNTLVDNIGKTV
ncbi:hypothetical protein AAG570_009815 [Ranatra chinensis]|uniref:Uncharacterized protein n=1 Tax=Ranatra chinensis TaxID=642074 RepID=A0ABD0YQ62_9HEMI